MDFDRFAELLAPWAQASTISKDDLLFGSGLDLSSISFLEFLMQVEDDAGIDIDHNKLDASVKTTGQLYERIFDRAP